MRPGGTVRLCTAVGAAVAAALVAGTLVGPAAAAPESCTYDGTTKTVTATVAAGGEATLVLVGGAIHFGLVPVACGDATTSNTDSIAVHGETGSNERLFIDRSGGVFGPGATSEFNPYRSTISEVEIDVVLGDATDTVVFHGTEGDDFLAAGQKGVPLNGDDDADVFVSAAAPRLEVHFFGGNDGFSGRGSGPAAGLEYLGQIAIFGGEGNDNLKGGANADLVDGGAGDDLLDGLEGDDILDGGPGNDTLYARGGNDVMTGGAGIDSFVASSGDDTIYAEDDESDPTISGGPGVDTAYYDEQVDPTPVAVENKVGDGGPPPPPAGTCSYDAATRTVSTSLEPGSTAILTVVGGAIHIGAVPEPCADATTANTDSIAISGAVGSVETLTIDLSGGALGPGSAAESAGIAEIEIATSLGDANDVVVVQGGPGDDTITIGQSGLGLNADADRDVTFAPLPPQIEIFGNGGVNALSAKGGSGTGSSYLGKAILRAGDLGDVLLGGSGGDELLGGAGNDRLEGNLGADLLDGAGGDDVLKGGDGDDELVGGAGADQLVGSSGDDTMRADDDEADAAINGGPGADTAYYDAATDPTPLATETLVPA